MQRSTSRVQRWSPLRSPLSSTTARQWSPRSVGSALDRHRQTDRAGTGTFRGNRQSVASSLSRRRDRLHRITRRFASFLTFCSSCWHAPPRPGHGLISHSQVSCDGKTSKTWWRPGLDIFCHDLTSWEGFLASGSRRDSVLRGLPAFATKIDRSATEYVRLRWIDSNRSSYSPNRSRALARARDMCAACTRSASSCDTHAVRSILAPIKRWSENNRARR